MAEIKEFERRFKFKPRLKYGWFHLKLYQMFQDLNRVLADLNRGSNSLNSISVHGILYTTNNSIIQYSNISNKQGLALFLDLQSAIFHRIPINKFFSGFFCLNWWIFKNRSNGIFFKAVVNFLSPSTFHAHLFLKLKLN